jgi:hypothetical protein
MGSDPIFWGILLCALAGGILLGRLWQHQAAQAARRRWPARWNLNARPLFTVHERALYRELRAALPQHVVLAKVSLLRFCQSADASDAKDWYKRLQALHVSIAVCTPNGVVVAAIDIDNGASGSGPGRAQKMKEGVLESCRVRYVRCAPGQWPQPQLLASWALGPTNGAAEKRHRNTPPDPLMNAGDQLARKLKERRAERASRWSESTFAQDSFFAFDSRLDGASTMPPVLEEIVPEDEARPAFRDTAPGSS